MERRHVGGKHKEKGLRGWKGSRDGQGEQSQGEAGVRSPPPRSRETGTDRKLLLTFQFLLMEPGIQTGQSLRSALHPAFCKSANLPVLSCSVMSDSFQPFRLYPARLLCPWDSPGRNTGVGCHFSPLGNLPDSEIETQR